MPLSPICPRVDWRSLSSAHALCLCHTLGTNQINQTTKMYRYRMDCHTPWARFGAMQAGWGPSAGPSRRGAEPSFPGRQSRLSRNQRSQTHGHKGRPGPARPGPARTEGQSALSQAGRPGPVRTEGQSPLSQADQDQHIVGIIEAQQVELSVVAPSYVESNTDGRDNDWAGRCTS